MGVFRRVLLAFAVMSTVVGSKVAFGTLVWAPLDADWQMGDRHIRCFLVVDGEPVTKSSNGG